MRRNVILVPVILLLSVLNLSLISDTTIEYSGENTDRQVRPALLPGERYFVIGTPAFTAYPVPAGFEKSLVIFYTAGGASPSEAFFFAPVSFRNKAIITRLDLVGFDGDIDTDLELKLWSQSNSAVLDNIVTVSSSGSAGTHRTWSSARFSEKITGNKQYLLEITFPAGTGSLLQFKYARLVVKGF